MDDDVEKKNLPKTITTRKNNKLNIGLDPKSDMSFSKHKNFRSAEQAVRQVWTPTWIPGWAISISINFLQEGPFEGMDLYKIDSQNEEFTSQKKACHTSIWVFPKIGVGPQMDGL